MSSLKNKDVLLKIPITTSKMFATGVLNLLPLKAQEQKIHSSSQWMKHSYFLELLHLEHTVQRWELRIAPDLGSLDCTVSKL